MKKGLVIGLIIGVIVLAAIAGGAYFFMNNFMGRAKVVEELSQIEEVTKSGEIDIEKLNEITDRTVTTGKYEAVEKAAKNYAKDLFTKANEMKNLLQDEKLGQMLTASNYQADGPEFVESKKYINEAKQKLQDGKAEMLGLIEEAKINSYIEAQTTDTSCIELYKQLLAEDINMPESEKKELETSVDKIVSALDIELEVLDFLTQNKEKWKVEGEQILFDSNTLVIKYNSFLTRLRI